MVSTWPALGCRPGIAPGHGCQCGCAIRHTALRMRAPIRFEVRRSAPSRADGLPARSSISITERASAALLRSAAAANLRGLLTARRRFNRTPAGRICWDQPVSRRASARDPQRRSSAVSRPDSWRRAAKSSWRERSSARPVAEPAPLHDQLRGHLGRTRRSGALRSYPRRVHGAMAERAVSSRKPTADPVPDEVEMSDAPGKAAALLRTAR